MSIKNMFSETSYDLVVFSHLRWEFVTQRPQHLINRISKGKKVLFVEEPIGFEPHEEGTAKLIKASRNITVLQPKIPHETMISNLPSIVLSQMKEMKMDKTPVIWFYSPMFVDMAKSIPHRAVVYDCMDELSLFRGAPRELVDNEKKLLNIADVVFTGGKSLYESKKQRHPNVHCFPSSVDKFHFLKALSRSTRVPDDIRHIKTPVVGYYGVIDERINLDLIEKTAEMRPEVSFVMVGPVVKIDEADLPRRDNIHYLGGKPYEKLPNYLKAFDIAFMPFALNDSTKFISPTKTLEFMAAAKPIISTPIYDVVRDYSEAVFIVDTAAEMAGAVDYYQAESLENKAERLDFYSEYLAKTSWDNTAEKMDELIVKAIKKSAKETVKAPVPAIELARL